MFLLSHCFFDNPHKYIWMLFPDFFEQINYLLNLSKKKQTQQWFYKRIKKGRYSIQILKKFPNVIFLDENFKQ